MADLNRRILSIQSHVVSGYVGQKSATFPLQLLGFEVDGINSVQFSNHTGYAKGVRGQVLDDTQLWELIEGLQANEIDHYSHIINGYIGSKSFLLKLAEVVKVLKKKNPKLTYVCDPVMGDFGPGMYVPKELLPIYKNEIVPLSDVCLPNQFEAELITEEKITNEMDAVRAMQKFHDFGVKTVILSSAEFHVDHLVGMASKLENGKVTEAFKIDIPKFPTAFVGTGDLFTALTTAWLELTGNDLKLTLEKTIASMQAVLNRTVEHANSAKCEGDAKPKPFQMELKLIQSKRDIEHPEIKISATSILSLFSAL